MYPRTHWPWRQDDSDQNSTPEGSFQYSVPEWFLENIKTPQELSDAKPKIWLNSGTSFQNDETEALEASDQKPLSEPMGDEHSSCYRVSQDTMDSLLDAAFSLQLRDRLGRISPSKSDITLSCCMRLGLQFLDELVLLLAQNINSTLITLSAYDLENVGLEFYHQEQEQRNNALVDMSSNVDDSGVIETNNSNDNIDDSDDNYDTSYIARKAFRCYFSACHKHRGKGKDGVRGKGALLAILKAVKNKALQAGADTAPCDTSQNSSSHLGMTESPIILYFRDVLSLHTRTYDWTPEAVIRKAVRERRKAGENITMIFAATHTDADDTSLDQDPQIPWKVKGCQRPLCRPKGWPGRVGTGGWIDPRRPRVHVLPLDVLTGWSQERKAVWRGSVTSTRIQSFKRRLNALLSQYPSNPPDLLEPYCDWLHLLPESVIHQFSSTRLNSEIQDAFNLILARCSRKGNIDLNDIRSILLQINKSDVPPIVKDDNSYQEDGFNEEYASQEEDASHEASSHAISEVQEEYNEWERDHLPCLINPTDNPIATFDIEAFYQNAVATIKAHLQLTRPSIGKAASSLAFQTRNQIVLLYGPPGTGKTCLAQHIARTLDFNLISVDQAIVRSFGLQSIKTSIKAIFSLATKVSRCIIFIDDAEILFDENDSSHEQRTITTQFLSCLDGLKDQDGSPFILAATNDPWRLDPAFLRRAYKIPIKLPTTQLRVRILRLFLTEDNLAHIDIDKLADLTEGFSGAELRGLCTEAAAAWVIQQDSDPNREDLDAEMILTDEDFVSALKNIRPSISETYLARLEDFTRRFVSGVPDAFEDDAWANFPLQTQKVVHFISSKETEEWNDPFFWEKRFLSLIINPKTIETSWSDLAIDTQTEQEIKQLINNHHAGGDSTEAYGLLRRSNTGGALVYGPPGTGKTDKYYGEGPRAIQGLFNLGKLLSPSIIFFDEADALFPSRETLQDQHETTNLNQMLLEMDGLSKSRENPFVLLATNLPGHLDTAVLRRIPNKFYFGHPNLLLRERIVKGLLKEEILHTAVHPRLRLYDIPIHRF
ncbi:hypothetical protein PG991_000743 [Apiospora marii]|uniref:AAA+ ATPase domain-containing protein n=1 Tax=Apiospora marii TaxID=335849 RepID=A0ABR1SSV0_9PEZI